MPKKKTEKTKKAESAESQKLVECAEHGPEPGYFVCRHVFDQGFPWEHVEHPGPLHPIGQITCGNRRPHEDPADPVHGGVLLCRSCARKLYPDAISLPS